jgi:orotidine-5'-phosphate decarboxylase
MANAHPTRATGKPSLALQLARYTAHLRSLPLGEVIAARVTFAAAEAGVIEPGVRPEPAPDAARTFRDTTLRLSSLVQAQTGDPEARRAVEEAFAEAGRFVLGRFVIATGEGVNEANAAQARRGSHKRTRSLESFSTDIETRKR